MASAQSAPVRAAAVVPSSSSVLRRWGKPLNAPPPIISLRPSRLAELRTRVRAACARHVTLELGHGFPPFAARRAEAPALLVGGSASSGGGARRGRRHRPLLPPPPRCSSSSSSSPSFLTPPLVAASVDEELWAALDVCLDDELEAVDAILHASSPFSPLLKQAPLFGGGGTTPAAPSSVARHGRAAVMHRVEARLRFLAADARATLAGEAPTYREVLLGLRDALGAGAGGARGPGYFCPRHLPTPELEAELLSYALERREEEEQEEEEEEERRRRRRRQRKEGDRRPASTGGGGAHAAVRGWADRLLAAGGGLLPSSSSALPRTLAQLGGAAAVSAAGRGAARALAGQYLSLVGSAAAQRAVVAAAARYSALRGALAMLGPAMWGCLALDLALRALGADHARVARAVFVLAQVRLVRTGGFVPAPPVPAPSPSEAFSNRLYGPLRPDGARGRARAGGGAGAAAVPAEFRPLPGGARHGRPREGGDDDQDDDPSCSGRDGGDDDDDDDDDQWLWGAA